MQNTQAKRQLMSRCFDCGQSHHAGHPSCRGSNLNCLYNCVNCKQRNDISSRGQSTLHLDVKAAKQSASSSPSARPPVATAAITTTAQTPAPPRAPSTRKRPASVICQRSFDACWSSGNVRKKGRYACVKDFLRVMDTDKAKSALPTVPERLETMAKRKEWPNDACKPVQEFSSGRGGGSPGVGATKAAMQDVYLDRGGQGI